MKAHCQLCLEDYTSLLSQPNSPVVPPCGHTICSNCLRTEMEGKPCYLRCGVVRVKETHLIRLKYIDTGVSNWKDILNSKSCHRLQVLNFELNKRAIDLDDERAILADALQDYTGGMILEQALHEVCTDLAALEAQDVALHQQIVQETEKLGQLEKKLETVTRTSRGG